LGSQDPNLPFGRFPGKSQESRKARDQEMTGLASFSKSFSWIPAFLNNSLETDPFRDAVMGCDSSPFQGYSDARSPSE
jgi:hypothetical protein